jgi:hypothetical protein
LWGADGCLRFQGNERRTHIQKLNLGCSSSFATPEFLPFCPKSKSRRFASHLSKVGPIRHLYNTMATLSLKLSNRAPKKPIRKLPASVELPHDATVEDAKVLIARQSGFTDYNRIGLFDPASKQILKNRKALVREEAGVAAAGELVVKDLGTLPVNLSCHRC